MVAKSKEEAEEAARLFSGDAVRALRQALASAELAKQLILCWGQDGEWPPQCYAIEVLTDAIEEALARVDPLLNKF